MRESLGGYKYAALIVAMVSWCIHVKLHKVIDTYSAVYAIHSSSSHLCNLSLNKADAKKHPISQNLVLNVLVVFICLGPSLFQGW